MFGRAWRLRCSDLEQKLAAQALQIAELSTKLSTTSGAALAVRCAEIEAALDQVQRSNRREFGKLWKSLGGDREVLRDDLRRIGPNGVDDPALAAMLALQSAPAAEPK